MEVFRHILIDYDNLMKNTNSSAGHLWTNIRHCVSKLCLETGFFDNVPNMGIVKVRLYGGWFDQLGGRTPLAATVISEIDNSSMQIIAHKNKPKLNVQVEMADGLAAMSGTTFYATCRLNAMDGLRLKPRATFCGCKRGKDAKGYLNEYFYSKVCSSCRQPIGEIFIHEGQKLVDSMMFCDAAFLLKRKSEVALVSSDDDMVPILFQLALDYPDHVVRILTETNLSTAYQNFYKSIQPKGLNVLMW